MLPVRNKITLANLSTGKLDGNLKYIYEELLRQDTGHEVKLFLHKSQDDFNGKIVYLMRMIQAAYHIATSSFFIVDDYLYPLYVVKPKDETTVVQVWHACGAFKKFGYSVVDKSFGVGKSFLEKVKIHSNYDCVLVSSKEVAKHYADGFHMDINKIISIGIPRTDIFFDEEKKEQIIKKLRNKYDIFGDKKLLLYASTFRGNSRFDAKGGCNLDMEDLKKQLGDDHVLILKLHPFVSQGFQMDDKYSDFAIDLSKDEDINELMILSDILITDYSSVVFEFALMEKPMVFYAYDLESYMDERDFYYNYEDFIPGPIARDQDELAKIIKNDVWDMDKIRQFKDKFFDYKDSGSTKRFIDKIIKGRD
nr:CDP-glycerol glycerophosphotransferase family protein [Alkalibacter mobilis]